MKLSIITVVFNNEKTIKNAIESVISQTYQNIEYIIIDGGSTDNTVKIISKYRDKIAYFVSENDQGIYHAMNKGLAVANGDVIGILNSDDLYFDKQVVENVMYQFKNNNSLDIVYGSLEYVKGSDVNKVVRNWKSKPYRSSFFEFGDVPPHPTLFLRNHVYESIGTFNLQFKLAADYEFMLRLFKSNLFTSMYIDQVFVKMRLGGATNQNFTNIWKQNREILNAWRINNFIAPFYLMPIRIFKRLYQYL